MTEVSSRRIPNLLHLSLFLALTIFCGVLAEAAVLIAARQPAGATFQNQQLQLLVNGLMYAGAVVTAWVLFPALWLTSFRSGIRWNGRQARPWLGVFGLVLGFVSEAVSTLLPVPKRMPIEDVLRTPGIIWALVVFGTVVAPVFEEIVFRGFLLPGIAIAVDWLKLPREDVTAIEAWRTGEGFSRMALVLSSLLTSMIFAGIHAPQLGLNWAPVLLLVCVSLVLCVVRIRMKSVAAAALVHGCYNFSVFLLLFVGTSGFRHFDRP